jgi:putative ferrous iron transport protein C
MILSDIRRYLQQRGQASLADLALHFDADPDAIRGMLQVWMRKGMVQRQVATASCGSSCSKCDAATTELYTWHGSSTAPASECLLKDCRQQSICAK